MSHDESQGSDLSDTINFDARDDGWATYRFNFNGAAEPPLQHLLRLNDTTLRFDHISNLLQYHFKPGCRDQARLIPGESLVPMISTTNSAHSICEIISFANLLSARFRDLPVVINPLIRKTLPFLHEILLGLISPARIIEVSEGEVVALERAILWRGTHFNAAVNWSSAHYRRFGDILLFENLSCDLRFDDSPAQLNQYAEEVYFRNSHRYALHDKIALIKTADDRFSTTPQRAITLSEQVRARLKDNDYDLLQIHQMYDITEYICRIYHAKKIITSYGGAACTNRFFANKESDVTLIGNMSYKWEYDYFIEDGDLWHLRHSHLFPVARQTVFLNVNDEISVVEIENILFASECFGSRIAADQTI